MNYTGRIRKAPRKHRLTKRWPKSEKGLSINASSMRSSHSSTRCSRCLHRIFKMIDQALQLCAHPLWMTLRRPTLWSKNQERNWSHTGTTFSMTNSFKEKSSARGHYLKRTMRRNLFIKSMTILKSNLMSLHLPMKNHALSPLIRPHLSLRWPILELRQQQKVEERRRAKREVCTARRRTTFKLWVKRMRSLPATWATIRAQLVLQIEIISLSQEKAAQVRQV